MVGRRALVLIVVLATTSGTLAAQAPPAPAGVAADAVPETMQGVRLDQRLGSALPAGAAFRDEQGRPVRLGDYFGERPVVLAFVYFDCPMLCSQVLQGLLRGLRPLDLTIGREFDVVVVSIDPSDTVADGAGQHRQYARQYGRDGGAGLHFLTGREAAIDEATRAAGFGFRFDPTLGLFFHPAAVTIVTPAGRISRYLTGIDFAPRDLKFALMEASADRIGTLSDRLQLYCYQYDPSTGRYSLLVFNLLRGGALLTAGALALLVAGTWWHERRRHDGGTV